MSKDLTQREIGSNGEGNLGLKVTYELACFRLAQVEHRHHLSNSHVREQAIKPFQEHVRELKADMLLKGIPIVEYSYDF